MSSHIHSLAAALDNPPQVADSIDYAALKADPGRAAIWAQSRDGVIGDSKRMPWHVPEDLAHFKKLTVDHTVVMGSTTWLSIPDDYRPLVDRRNVVLSRRQPGDWSEGATVTTTIPAAPVWIVGGGTVYEQTINDCANLIVTVFDAQLTGLFGDNAVFAPHIPEKFTLVGDTGWKMSATGHLLVGSGAQSHAPLRYRFLHFTTAERFLPQQ